MAIKQWLDWLDRMPRWFRRLAGVDSAVSIGSKIWLLVEWILRGAMFLGVPLLAYVQSNPNMLWGLVFPIIWIGLEYGLVRSKRTGPTRPSPITSTLTVTKAPVPVIKSRRPTDLPLVDQLTDLLAEGVKLLDNWYTMGSGVMPRGRITNPEDVEIWELEVTAALMDARPIHLLMFRNELPPPTMSEMATSSHPNRRRLVHRVHVLERIIVEMRGY